MTLISKILAKCGGAYIKVLKKCPSESSKYVAVGITIIFTGIFAALSGGYAFFKVFNKETILECGYVENSFFHGSIFMGILWGLMIFNLDRYIVMSMKKQNNIGKELLVAVPRIILAVIISLVVAKPLEVRLFQDRIASQISDNELEKRDQNRKKIYSITNKLVIDSLKSFSEMKVTSIKDQLRQECPTQECKDAFEVQKKEKEKYYEIRKNVQPLINKADENIRFIKYSDRYKTITIIDGIEKKELTIKGKKLLVENEQDYNKNLKKRQAQWAVYKSKLSVYDTINSKYKNSKQKELEVAQEEDNTVQEQKNAADKQTLELEKKSGDAANIAFTNNFITQLEALGDLTKWKENVVDENNIIIERKNNIMWYMNIAIILLFIVIETAPIFVKLITSKGQYDIALEAQDTKKESEFIHEANTYIAIEEQKSQLQLQVLMNNQQAQLGMLQTAIQSWQSQKTTELNSGQLSDADFKKIIQEILEFDIINDKKNSVSKKKKETIIEILLNKVKKGIYIEQSKLQKVNAP